MCGRFSLTTQEDQIERLFNVEVDRKMYVPRYNGAPTQNFGVITSDEPSKLSFLRWGLVPTWAKDPRDAARMINARAETVREKPAFRNAFVHRRCLIPADGFFEWKKSGGSKQAWRIVMANGLTFAFAGIWEEWKDAEGRPLRTFSILTTSANELMKDIHDRMPVILPFSAYEPYLNAPADKVAGLLLPYPAGEMTAFPVSALVNSPRNDSPDVIKPIEISGNSLF